MPDFKTYEALLDETRAAIQRSRDLHVKVKELEAKFKELRERQTEQPQDGLNGLQRGLSIAHGQCSTS